MVRDAFVRKPTDRFEWERIMRRVEMPSGVKYLGLMLSTYADSDGSRVFPGVEKLSLVMCVGTATVKRSLGVLRDLGFVERVRQGNRHAGLADEYRLTIPSDLLSMRLLNPDECSKSGDHPRSLELSTDRSV